MVTHSALRGVLLAALTVASISLFVTGARAAPAIDQTFGKGGFVTPTVFPHRKKFQTARDIAIQSDGKVVVPMTLPYSYGHRSRRPVIRLNANGTRDKSFGRAGVGWVRAGSAPYITLLGVTTLVGDGTLVWGEYKFKKLGPYDGVFVAKLSAKGLQEMNFGDHGARKFSYSVPRGAGDKEFLSAYAAGDGGVIVAADIHTFKDERNTVTLTRLTPSGSTDKSFGKRGTRRIPIERGASVAGFTRGIVVTGNSLYLSVSRKRGCGIRRYTLSGSVPVDLSFGNAGLAIAGAGVQDSQEARCLGLSASPTGSLLMYGELWTKNAGPIGAFLQKLKLDGSVDPTFGPNGYTTAGSLELAYRAVELPGGAVLAAGACDDPTSFDGCLSLVDASGAPVTSFGKGGTLNLGKYEAGYELEAGSSSAIALISNDSSKSYLQTRILKLTAP